MANNNTLTSVKPMDNEYDSIATRGRGGGLSGRLHYLEDMEMSEMLVRCVDDDTLCTPRLWFEYAVGGRKG